MDPFLIDYVILPMLILLARVVDVSMDTVRTIMVAKGYRNYAPVIGFFQSLIWVIQFKTGRFQCDTAIQGLWGVVLHHCSQHGMISCHQEAWCDGSNQQFLGGDDLQLGFSHQGVFC